MLDKFAEKYGGFVCLKNKLSVNPSPVNKKINSIYSVVIEMLPEQYQIKGKTIKEADLFFLLSNIIILFSRKNLNSNYNVCCDQLTFKRIYFRYPRL
jgi:hypothetical protein